MRRLLVLVAVVLVMGTVTASAHVSVNPSSTAKGGFAKLAFRVPNERPNSGTNKVEVFLPPEHPLASVSVRPVPGWTATLERTKLDKPITVHGREVAESVTHITWTGGPIKPGEFQEFDVSVGPLPDNVDRLVFKAIQTYENGEVVRWIEEPAPGAAEPERPAPILTLTAGGDDHGTGSTATTATTATTAAGGAGGSGGDSGSVSDGNARALGAGAFALSVVALLVALLRRPKPSAPA